jgi:hypothetical protein
MDVGGSGNLELATASLNAIHMIYVDTNGGSNNRHFHPYDFPY